MSLWGLAVPMRTALKKTYCSESFVGTQDTSLVLLNIFFHVHFNADDRGIVYKGAYC